MNHQSTGTLRLAQGAVIAAAYVVLTWLSALANLAYGPVQFRISEALTILPVFTSAAVPGLAIGCLLSNILSGYGIYDMVFGTLATLLAALLTRAARNVRPHGVPVLSAVPPVVLNAFIVGFEITVVNNGTLDSAWMQHFNQPLFWSNAASVGLGELVVCFALGLPLAVMICKHKRLKLLIEG